MSEVEKRFSYWNITMFEPHVKISGFWLEPDRTSPASPLLKNFDRQISSFSLSNVCQFHIFNVSFLPPEATITALDAANQQMVHTANPG